MNNNYNNNYMSSDWGNSQTKYTAMNIDHIADKARLSLQMLKGIVDGFDTIEREIIDASNASNPITREGLRAFAYRIDGQQNQIKNAIQSLEQMMVDIDKTTDKIQSPKTSW